jgi:hypothetical protein
MATKVKVYKIRESVEAKYPGKVVVGMSNIAIITKDNTAIMIEDDACHYISDFPKTFKIGLAVKEEGKIKLFPEGFICPTVEYIVNNIDYEEKELPEWIFCYNVKSRIIDNCNGLRKTLKDFGFNTEEYLPKK